MEAKLYLSGNGDPEFLKTATLPIVPAKDMTFVDEETETAYLVGSVIFTCTQIMVLMTRQPAERYQRLKAVLQ